jgi:transposase
MPKQHQEYLKWTPSRIVGWAAKTGPNAKTLVEEILKAQKHPELGYRRCLGILRLGQKYGQDRLEAACARALATGARSYQSVKSILETGLDRKVFVVKTRRSQGDHRNIRGQAYYK